MCDRGHRLRFVLMERSLRAVGCELPIWVIPYGPERFELPKNSTWWEIQAISAWSTNFRKQKYQCLTTGNFQFVDSDVFFLRNPEPVLAPHQGLIACCNEWTMASFGRVATDESRAIMRRRTTLWQRSVFCAGQFACDRAL